MFTLKNNISKFFLIILVVLIIFGIFSFVFLYNQISKKTTDNKNSAILEKEKDNIANGKTAALDKNLNVSEEKIKEHFQIDIFEDPKYKALRQNNYDDYSIKESEKGKPNPFSKNEERIVSSTSSETE